MGYTHYWYTNLNGIPQKNWSAICEDVKKLLASLPALEWVWAVLGDEYGLPPALWPLPQTATV